MDELSRLANAARLGDRDALEALVESSYSEVWRLCAGLVDARAADDLAQETYLRAVPALRRFRGEASARTWLLSIARRTCADEIRSRMRRRERDDLITAERRDADAFAPDAADEVGSQDLLSQLAPERRTAFVLTQLLRLSYEEAATVCDCPVGTIRSRVARAREDLVRQLGRTESSGRPDAKDHPASGDPRSSV